MSAAVSVTVELAQVPVDPVATPSRYNCTVISFSHEAVKLGVVCEVTLSVLESPVSDPAVRSGVPGAAGAVVSIVTLRPEDAVDRFPAGSVALALTECEPSARAAVVRLTVELAQVPEEPVGDTPM
jgi:hypothetical protein